MNFAFSLYSLVVLAAALWSLFVVAASIYLGEAVLFLPSVGADNDVAIHQRAEVLRLSFFLLFAYFSLMHLFDRDRYFSSGHVIISILTSLTFVGVLVLSRSGADSGAPLYLSIFAIAAIIIFMASRPRVKRYFRRR